MSAVSSKLSLLLRRIQWEKGKLDQIKFSGIWLNTPWSAHESPSNDVARMQEAWNASSLRVATDGAADRLAGRGLTPDIIIGDMDSYSRGDELFRSAVGKVPVRKFAEMERRTEKMPWASTWYKHVQRSFDKDYLSKLSIAVLVREEFRNTETDSSTYVICNPDENSGDVEKALAMVSSVDSSDGVLILGQFAGFQGRVDHTFLLANILYKYATAQSYPEVGPNSQNEFNRSFNRSLVKDQVPIVAMSPESIMCCLPKGETEIPLPSGEDQRRKLKCGLIPLGCETIATTSGLQWNLHSDHLKWGELVSCCNRPDEMSDTIRINLSEPALWTQRIQF